MSNGENMTNEDIREREPRQVVHSREGHITGSITKPGELIFIEKLETSDGRLVEKEQKIPLPPDLFTPPTYEIIIERIPDIEPGASVPVRFDVRGGPLYEGDQIIWKFSKTAPPSPSDPPSATIRDYMRRDFTFRSQLSDASDTCFIAIEILGSNGTLLAGKVSDPFKIRPAVPQIFRIDPIKPEILHGESVPITFTFSHPKRISKFKLMLKSTSPSFTLSLPDLAPTERGFTFIAPSSLEGDAIILSMTAFDESGNALLPIGNSNPFRVHSEREEFTISPIRPEVDQGQIIPMQFIFNSRSRVSGFNVLLINRAKGLTRNISPKIAPDSRNFSFSVPADIDGPEFSLAITAQDEHDVPFKFAHTNLFTIRRRAGPSPLPSGITLDLWQPIRGQRLQAGTRVELHWKIDPRDLTSDLSIGYAVERQDGNYSLIDRKLNAQDRGVIPWTIPNDIPNNTQVFIKLKLERENIYSAPFGPFIITGGINPGTPDTEGENPTEEISMLEQLLKQGLSLPKRSSFARYSTKTLNIAQFASNLIYAPKSDLRREIQEKVPVIISRLEALRAELERENYSNKDSHAQQIFSEFMDIYTQIEKNKENFLQLNNPSRIREIQNMGSFALDKVKASERFTDLFNRSFSPRLESHDWDRICIDPNKLAFLFREHDVHGVTTITHVYNFFSIYYDKLMILDGLFNKMKRILSQIRKDIKTNTP